MRVVAAAALSLSACLSGGELINATSIVIVDALSADCSRLRKGQILLSFAFFSSRVSFFLLVVTLFEHHLLKLKPTQLTKNLKWSQNNF